MTYEELRYFKFFNGKENEYTIMGICVFCSGTYSLNVNENQFNQIVIGKGDIQDILPHHSVSDREFLISGICSRCRLNDGKNDNERELDKLVYRFDQLKEDYLIFKKILEENKIEYFYHFTDEANLPSIKKYGALYSLQYLNENNIIHNSGGSEKSKQMDYRLGLANFIRLSFVKDHPMRYVAVKEGRINTPYLLKIDSDLLLTRPSLFTHINAATKKVKTFNRSDRFSEIEFGLFRMSYFDLDQQQRKKYQAEILIPERIEKKFIMSITKVTEL